MPPALLPIIIPIKGILRPSTPLSVKSGNV
jgi:hypothetical protein